MLRSLAAPALLLLAACASTPAADGPPLDAPQPDARVEPLAEPDPGAMPQRAGLPIDAGAFYLPTLDPLHPRVRYVDGQASLNESCIVLAGNKLSRRVPPAYVNGRPIGFC